MLHSISLVPDSGTGVPAKYFALETGGIDDLVVQGNLVTLLEGIGAGTEISTIQIAVGVKGELVSDGNKSTLVGAKSIVYDSTISGPLIVQNQHAIPFSIDLKQNSLPPTFPLDASLTQNRYQVGELLGTPLVVRYVIKAIASFIIDNVKHVKETQADLFILSPASLRALLLASQTPLSIANGDDGNPSDDVNFMFTLARRVVLQGGTLFGELNAFVPPTSSVRVGKLVLSLCSKLVLRNTETGDISRPHDTVVWAMVTENIAASDVTDKMASLDLSHNSASELTRMIKLDVPERAFCSMETAKFSYSYFLRLEILDVNSPIPAAQLDVPVVITQSGDIMDSRTVPLLIRNKSSDASVVKENLELSKVGVFSTVWNYAPFAPDEIGLKKGDAMHVYHVYPDGMAYGENLTSHVKGMVPIHHLVELSYVDPNPPPYPLSPVASLSRIQAGEGFTPVSPTLSSKKVEATLSPRPPSYIPLSPSESTDSKKALSPSMSKNTMNTGRTPSTMTTSSVGTSGSKGGFFSKFKKQETETISVAPVRPITVDGVVNVETLVAHLGLLHRFCVLENKDDQLADWRYLCRAEQRYLMWLDYLREEQPDPSSIPLPPLDVALMWHSHMLNPHRYLEDCYFVFGGAKAYSMPFERMHNVQGLEYLPDDGSQEVWTAFTKEAFTIPLGDYSPFNFCCPWCRHTFLVDADQFVSFRMKDTSIQCLRCSAQCTADNISGKRFLDDITRFQQTRQIMMGTALDEKTGAIAVAKAIQDMEVVLPKDPNFGLQGSIATTSTWASIEASMKNHFQVLRQSRALKNNVRKSTVPKMFRAYKDIPIPLSLDLVAAVIRQRSFTGKMVGVFVDWEERDALPRATLRYRDFLSLMKKEPTKFLVPTLDVDLAWHTHQCYPVQYQNFGLRELKRVINHDDSVESETLTKSFDATAKAWKHHYNQQYSALHEESKWFRRPTTLVYPTYTRDAASRAVTIARPTANMMGGCAIHDPTPPPVPGRRSAAMYPIGAALGTQTTYVRGAQGTNVRNVVVVGGCYGCAVVCGGWGFYGPRFHPWGYGPYFYGPVFWGGCGAFYGCGYFACGGCGAFSCGAVGGCGAIAVGGCGNGGGCGSGGGGCGSGGGGCGGGGGGCGGGGCGGGCGGS